MSESQSISPNTPHFTTDSENIVRPLPFVHPTRARFSASSTDITGQTESRWSSRASRKSRYASKAIRLTHHHLETVRSRQAVVVQRLHHPTTRLKVRLTWGVSFWVAIAFLLGSVAWVVNGFYLLLPLLNVASDHNTAAVWWAFAGGTLFEVGGYLMYIEALNAGHGQLFGPALWGLVSRSSDSLMISNENKASEEKGNTHSPGFRWIGLGPWPELGFLASFIQMLAATIFWVSTITGLPGVISGFPDSPLTAITDVFYWTPQVVGGCGFIVSSLLLMIEVQTNWWKPNLRSLGWHVGLWNLVGAVGFTLCGALGYASLGSTKANYQSVLSTFWGGWGFLIGSTIQLWEILWREDAD